MTKRYTVYGFGLRGCSIVDQLIEQNIDVEMIFDAKPSQTVYKDIPVRKPTDADALACMKGSDVIIALHNCYVDLHQVDSIVKQAGGISVSIIAAILSGLPFRIEDGYWLDPSSSRFIITESEKEWVKSNLSDSLSCTIIDGISRYRATGQIGECPRPSLDDQYLPKDLPRYREPISLLDGGAFEGTIYQDFATYYSVKEYFAFEPDDLNFKKLSSYTYGAEPTVLLPLGLSNASEKLSFSGGNGMGSAVDKNGSITVQCISLDQSFPNIRPNIVKLDIEGSELKALIGMKKLIKRHRPSLCISVYHRPEDLVDITHLILSWELDYSLHLRVHEHNCFGLVLYARPI